MDSAIKTLKNKIPELEKNREDICRYEHHLDEKIFDRLKACVVIPLKGLFL